MLKKDSLDAPLDYEKVEDSPLLPPQQQESSGFQSLHQDDGLDRKEWVHSEHCILCSFVSCVYRAASFLVHTVAPNFVRVSKHTVHLHYALLQIPWALVCLLPRVHADRLACLREWSI